MEELGTITVGWDIVGDCTLNFSCADDMALLNSSVYGVSKLLAIYGLNYNVRRTEMMVFKHDKWPDIATPDTILGTTLYVVSTFKHIITDWFIDD